MCLSSPRTLPLPFHALYTISQHYTPHYTPPHFTCLTPCQTTSITHIKPHCTYQTTSHMSNHITPLDTASYQMAITLHCVPHSTPNMCTIASCILHITFHHIKLHHMRAPTWLWQLIRILIFFSFIISSVVTHYLCTCCKSIFVRSIEWKVSIHYNSSYFLIYLKALAIYTVLCSHHIRTHTYNEMPTWWCYSGGSTPHTMV